MSRLWIAVLVAGCAHAHPAAPREPAESCNHVGEHVASLMTRGDPSLKKMRLSVQAVITAHCEQEGWSFEARHCMVTAKTADAAKACNRLLAPHRPGQGQAGTPGQGQAGN